MCCSKICVQFLHLGFQFGKQSKLKVILVACCSLYLSQFCRSRLQRCNAQVQSAWPRRDVRPTLCPSSVRPRTTTLPHGHAGWRWLASSSLTPAASLARHTASRQSPRLLIDYPCADKLIENCKAPKSLVHGYHSQRRLATMKFEMN